MCSVGVPTWLCSTRPGCPAHLQPELPGPHAGGLSLLSLLGWGEEGVGVNSGLQGTGPTDRRHTPCGILGHMPGHGACRVTTPHTQCPRPLCQHRQQQKAAMAPRHLQCTPQHSPPPASYHTGMPRTHSLPCLAMHNWCLPTARWCRGSESQPMAVPACTQRS
jgi:hypothetical protein